MDSHGHRPSGPRPKPPDKLLRNRVALHLSDEHFARLMKIVNETGDGISTVARNLLVDGLSRTRTAEERRLEALDGK